MGTFETVFLLTVIAVVLLWIFGRGKLAKRPAAQMARVFGKGPHPPSHVKKFDHDFAVTWAREILAAADRVVILDTETTGIKKNDEVLQVAAIDCNGNVLLDTLVNPPTRKRWPKAQAIHGISPEMVREAPPFAEIYPQLRSLLSDGTAVFYNARFDSELIAQTCEKAGLPVPNAKLECAMIQYSLFKGHWNDYRGHYTWHKLPGSKHTALADCRATLELINKMARDT